MARSITVNGDKRLLRNLQSLDGALDSSFLREASEYTILQIQKRTLKGKDADGKAFKPYSPQYRSFRIQKKRQGKPVNLFFHGDMFLAMTYDVKTLSKGNMFAQLYFMNTSDRSGAKNPQKAFFLHQDREFFALSKDDIDGIMRIARSHVREKLRGRT